MKDRKELFCGTASECLNWISRDGAPDHVRYEIVRNESGPECSVFYRRKIIDRTIRAKVTRETREKFRVNGVTKDHNRPLKVSLEPGDIITFCPKGTSQRVTVPIGKLYNLAKFIVASSIANAKRAAKKNKRK